MFEVVRMYKVACSAQLSNSGCQCGLITGVEQVGSGNKTNNKGCSGLLRTVTFPAHPTRTMYVGLL